MVLSGELRDAATGAALSIAKLRRLIVSKDRDEDAKP